MNHFQLIFAFVVVIISSLLLLTVDADVVNAQPQEAPTTPPPKTFRKPFRRSLFQACRSDMQTLQCFAAKQQDGTGAGRSKALRGAVSCLEENFDKIKDSTCKNWLKARAKCAADTKMGDFCVSDTDNNKKESDGDDNNNNNNADVVESPRSKRKRRASHMMDDVTSCLMSTDPTKLSQECRQSDYYRSLIFQKLWRARRDRNITPNFKRAFEKNPERKETIGEAVKQKKQENDAAGKGAE